MTSNRRKTLEWIWNKLSNHASNLDITEEE